MTIRKTFLFVTTILWAASAYAGEQMTLAGSATRALPPKGGSIYFPAKVEPQSTVDVVDITLDGAPIPTDNISASIDPRGFLVISLPNGAVREAGTYAVTVRARAGDNAQLLSVTLTRPAADLRFAPGIARINRTIYFPGMTCVSPLGLTLNNASRFAAVTPSQTTWKADLRSSDNTIVGRIRLDTPGEMRPLTNASTEVSVVGDPPLGTATAVVRITAPELSGGAIEQTVEVVSRLSLWWLFITIVLGIVAGYFCRVVLERIRLRADALVSASMESAYLHEQIRMTPDAEDVAALEDIVRELGRTMGDPRKSAEQIMTEAKTASDAAQTVTARANESRTKASQAINDLRSVLGVPETQIGPIAAAIGEALHTLDTEQQALAAGESHRVVRDMTTFAQKLGADLDELLAEWITEVRSALDRLGSWPALPAVGDTAAEIREKVTGLSDGDLRTRLDTARHIAALHRALFRKGRQAIVQSARSTLSSLPATSGEAATKITAARDAAEAVESWNTEPSGRALDDLLTAFGRLRSTLDDAVTASAAHPSEKALSSGEQPPPSSPQQVDADIASAATVAENTAVARLVVTGSVLVGQPLSYRIVSATALPLPQIAQVTWTADGKTIVGAAQTFRDTPSRPGLLSVIAHIRFADGSQTDAFEALEILPARRFALLDDLLATRRRAEWLQTAAAGMLITIGGFLIFKNAFVGTIEDLAGALLWGFGTDIGLARVREMSLPLLQKTVPSKIA